MRDFMFCAVWRVFDINYLFFFQISNVLSIYFSFDIKMKLIATIAFICFHTVTCTTSMSPDIYVGATDLQIGFGDNCHLFWRGDDGYKKNAEFRCGTSKGDPMWIKKSGHRYAIGAETALCTGLGIERRVSKMASFVVEGPSKIFST